ncbi:MAG: orotidine-5'-phosphate decarboxylase [Candidatus Eisenbacteria bacterium]
MKRVVGAGQKLIVALDFPVEKEALSAVDRLLPEVSFFKVGAELFVASGPSVVTRIKERGAGVFLDLKFHDIPNTMKGAVACATRLGADIISVHISAGQEALKSASEAVREASVSLAGEPILAGVTVLTSLESREEAPGGEATRPGVAAAVRSEVVRLAQLAVAGGLTGIITSVREAGEVRRTLGPGVAIITPGIRLSAGVDDHKRAGTVGDALLAGADFLVVGRPITKAEDPKNEALRFLDEISRAAGAM